MIVFFDCVICYMIYVSELRFFSGCICICVLVSLLKVCLEIELVFFFMVIE